MVNYMNKIIFLLISFFLIHGVKASDYTELFISKKDINTQEYVTDCDFLLYDLDNNIIDSWISHNGTHRILLKKGNYTLVERPLLENVFSSDLGKVYKLDINSDEAMEITLYNNKIETPRNLGFNNNLYLFGSLFVVLGFIIIVLFYRQFLNI